MKSKISIAVIAIFILLLLAVSYFFFFYEPSTDNNASDDIDSTESNNSFDDDFLYESIEKHPNDSYQIFPNITHDNVKHLLRNVVTPENFCWYYRSALYSESGVLSENGILLADGDKYKIEIYSIDNQLKKTVIKEGELVSVSMGSNNVSPVTYTSTEFSLFSEAGVPDASSFINNTSEQFTYALADNEYGSMIQCRFENSVGNYTQTEEYYISLDYGIVVKAQCFENDNLIYSLETTALYELENISNS